MKTLSITPGVGAFCLAIALAIGMISALIPAWNASRAPILESLRNTG
jgi:ABC-type antimicrobial peptide transport system permease subunit